MLESIRRGQRWLTGLFILAIGGVFVFFVNTGSQTGGGSLSDEIVVAIDDHEIDRLDFERLREAHEQRYRESLGDQFDSRAASAFLDQQTLRTLVEQAVLVHGARELGLRATKKEIQRYLRRVYRDEEGRFNQERVVALIEQNFGTQRAFLQTMERELLAQKMVQLLHDQARVSEAELRDLARYSAEEVQLAYVTLDTRALPADQTVSDEEIDAFLAANEEALQREYELRAAEFEQPERVHIRHLLVGVDFEEGEESIEAARAEAEAARQRILAGEDFAEVAREISDDPGSREAGGDLGFVARSETSLALSEAAFALEPGSVSELIQGEGGFHVVRVEERRPGGTRSFDEVKGELARESAAREAAAARAQQLAETLAQAVREGASLEDAARAQGLTLERTEALRRRSDGFVPGLGPAPDVLTTAFALPQGTSSPRVFPVGPEDSQLLLIQVLERSDPDAAEIEASLASLRERLLQEKRNQLVAGWIDSIQRQLGDEGRLRVNASFVTGS